MKRIYPTSGTAHVIHIIRRWGGLILSLILFIISFGIYYISRDQNEITYVNYIIAKRDIPALEIISPNDLSVIQFAEQTVPPNGIDEKNVENIIGKKAIISIKKGDLLSPTFFGLQELAKGNNITSAIPTGKRLQYLNVTDFHSLPPNLNNNNRIDIYSILTDERNTKAEKVLSSIEVFDIVQGKIENKESVIMVGLLFTDSQSQIISSYLNDTWKLNMVLIPQNEPIPSVDIKDVTTTSSQSAQTKE